MDDAWRVRGRRLIAVAVLGGQALLVGRGFVADHAEGAWRMFPEASDWRAEIVRVAPDGTRRPVSEAEWNRLVRAKGLSSPSTRSHADAGVDNQLAFFRSALAWFDHHDGEDGHLEARVTYWHNMSAPDTVEYRT